MKKNRSKRAEHRPRAFTSIELLAVVAILFILATITVPALFASRERVLRGECTSNLRQIGVGLSVYTSEANGYVPICGWPSGQFPWQTYTAARVVPGTSTITRGYMSLGLLFRTGVIPDPRTFYCPSIPGRLSAFSYEYYASGTNVWPSTPVTSGDEQVRTSYNYYPQLRATSIVGGVTLPQLNFAQVQLEFSDSGILNLVAPAKLTEIDAKKSVATDLVHAPSTWAHLAYGSVIGLNALFPDGAVVFQSARSNPAAFSSTLWQPGGGIVGNDPAPSVNFRTLMNAWKP